MKKPVSSKSGSKPGKPPAKKPAKKPVHKIGVHAHEVRIIGGEWKRTKLKVTDKPGLRPTPDRVRETLFNWLGQDLTGWRCIDVFAGTGALGFEAASRGAKEVRLVEHDPALVDQLKGVQIQLQASMTQIVRGDGVMVLKQCDPNSMDVIFLDPPFTSGAADAAITAPSKHYEPALQAAGRAVSTDGFVYLEAPSHWTDAQLEPFGLVEYRYLKAGAVHAHLLKKIS
jgi:16S rRNA (guanine966-N2)-methyltransferase